MRLSALIASNTFFYLLCTAVLYVLLTYNYTHLPHITFKNHDNRYDDVVDPFSEGIVRNKITDDIWANGENSKGFLIYFESFFQSDFSYKKENAKLYLKQFGLQGRMYSSMVRMAGVIGIDISNRLPEIFILLRNFNLLLVAFTLALFITAIKREFGIGESLLTLIFLSQSAGIVLFSRNLYWFAFTFLFPFCFFWYFYPKIVNSPRLVYACVAFFIFLKSLNGYEGLTAVILSTLVPIMYYERRLSSNIKGVYIKLLGAFVSGVCGFFIAMAVHFMSVALYVSSLKDIFLIIKKTVVLRNLTYIEPPINQYLGESVFIIPFLKNTIEIYFLIPLIFIYTGYLWGRKKITRIDGILILSFISSLCWFIFGYEHIAEHPWFLYLMINVSFVPIFVLSLSLSICSYTKLVIARIKNYESN